MMNLLRLLAFLPLLFPIAGHAQEAPVCRGSWVQGQAILQSRNVRIVELTPAQREALQADYNEHPPISNDHFTHVYTAELPDGDLLLVVLEQDDDCVVEVGKISRERLLSIIERHST